jgi:hypothetical protein
LALPTAGSPVLSAMASPASASSVRRERSHSQVSALALGAEG